MVNPALLMVIEWRSKHWENVFFEPLFCTLLAIRVNCVRFYRLWCIYLLNPSLSIYCSRYGDTKLKCSTNQKQTQLISSSHTWPLRMSFSHCSCLLPPPFKSDRTKSACAVRLAPKVVQVAKQQVETWKRAVQDKLCLIASRNKANQHFMEKI